MATIKSFTSLEQSRKLAEILPLESADQTWARIAIAGANLDVPEELQYRHNGDMPFQYYSGIGIPCWSLAALRNLLPVGIKINENTYLFESHNTFDKSWVYRYYNENGTSYLYYKNTMEVNACYELILKLHELNLL